MKENRVICKYKLWGYKLSTTMNFIDFFIAKNSGFLLNTGSKRGGFCLFYF